MNPNPDQMAAALRLIGGDCERFTRGLCSDEPHLSPYAQYGAARWCDPCIARAGLAGTLPDPDELKGTSAYKAGYFQGHVDGYNKGRDDALAGITATGGPKPPPDTSWLTPTDTPKDSR